MIHNALVGSPERFFGILIEHYAGAFPLWLAPIQVRILPVSEKNAGYAESVRAALHAAGIRAEVDGSDETLNKKIRAAEMEKIPYSAIVGEREANAKTVAVRLHGKGDQGTLDLHAWIARLRQNLG